MISFHEAPISRRDVIAGDAKRELNVTNQTHIPWINAWALASLALYVGFVLTDKAKLLPLAAMCVAFPMTGMMIRSAALIRRSWGVYDSMIGGLNPDSISKLHLAWGNLQCLLLPIALLGLILDAAQGRIESHLDRNLMAAAYAIFFVGVLVYAWADSRTPKFRS